MLKKIRIIIADPRITIAALILVAFGSLMIGSAEMGNSAGDTAYLWSVMIRQGIYALSGIIVYFILIFFPYQRIPLLVYLLVYGIIGFMLVFCLAFGQINGAYAWISLPGGATIQPSEFAKVFMIVFGSRLLGKDRHEDNVAYFWTYAILTFIYFVIICFMQHDFGSAIVLFVVCYCCALIPDYRELKKISLIMKIMVIAVIGLALFVMSPPFTEFLKQHADNYMVGRFLAAADPFLYQYDNGYHIIMSLVSFANGGIFGLGLGNSIHKYMNFPNPSNDFILPVIVEELGIIGFSAFIITYGIMLYPIIAGSFRAKYLSSKIVMMGVFIYFITHFILNVGGVSGLIPLTGVPLLMISSGGSSLMAALAGLGVAQNELRRNDLIRYESYSRKIQENAVSHA